LPDVLPVEACYLGWQQSLRNLAKLLSPTSTSEAVLRRPGKRDWHPGQPGSLPLMG